MANVALRGGSTGFYGLFLKPAGYNDGYAFADYKTQIDRCRFLGANFVVFWGDVRSTVGGYGDLTRYIVQRREVVEYIAGQGMYCLSYASYNPNAWDSGLGATYGVTNAQAITVMTADAAMQSAYPHVIGYVTMDEPYLSSWSDATVAANAAAQYSSIKAVVATDFPICANPYGHGGDIFDYTGAYKTEIDGTAPYCDFFAFHPLYGTYAQSNSAALRAAYPGKEIIMPSAAMAVEGDATVTARMASVAGLIGTNGFRGFAYWVAQDFDANTWGMFDSGWAERATKTAAFRACLPNPVTYYPHGHVGASGGGGLPVFAPWSAL